MLKSKKVAVTGGIASGKGCVCELLSQQGADVVNADEIVHKLLTSDPNVQEKVTLLLGPEIVENGAINKQTVAKKVFNQPDLLKSLEQILHPAVEEIIQKEYEKSKSPLFVAEIPLLYEAGFDKNFETVIAVKADEETCMSRANLTEEEYNQRMKRQLSPEIKAERADFVIHNNGSLEELKQQTLDVYQKLFK